MYTHYIFKFIYIYMNDCPRKDPRTDPRCCGGKASPGTCSQN